MPEDFSNIDKSIQSTTEKLSANQTILGNALSESTQAFDKTTEISESLTEAYEFQSQKIEEMISKFTDVLNEYKETSKESKELLNGFKGMDEQIAQIFEHINENTKVYSEVIGNSLTNYLNGFTEATKGVSAKFADATDALREEVEKLNKSEKLKEKK
jgi:ABC-type transporter Mla subunit MlaD